MIRETLYIAAPNHPRSVEAPLTATNSGTAHTHTGCPLLPPPPPHDNFHLEGFNRSFILICMRTSRCQCLYVNHASSYRHRGASDPHALNPTLDAPFCGVNDARGKTTTVYRRSMAFFSLLFFFFFPFLYRESRFSRSTSSTSRI